MSNSPIPPEAPTHPLEEDSAPGHAWRISAGVEVGEVLAGRYRLTALIGEGGMSRVYEALDQRPPAPGPAPVVIAVKVFAQPFDERDAFAALCAQVDRWRRLEHPHIVRVFDCERDGSIALITMEYLPGESAYAKLHRGPSGSAVPLEAAEARLIVAQIASALEYAHGEGVVHGDLKPGNIMVSRESGTKVIDFGVSRWLAQSGAPGLGASVAFAATGNYATPGVMAGEVPGPSDDVFSLACVAYELLTGVHPFDGRTHAPTPEPAPPQRPGVTPSEYAALVRALAAERVRRTASIGEFMAEFAAPSHRPQRRRWPLYVGLAAAAIAGVYLWSEHRNAPPAPPGAPLAQAPRAPAATPPTPGLAPAVAPAPAPAALQAGAIIQDCPSCPAMTVLPPGEFEQGAGDGDRDALPLERPRHAVRLSHPFAMSTTEITVDDIRQFAVATRRDFKGCDTYDGEWRHRPAASWQSPGFRQSARHPAACVSWNDAVAYAAWLSGKTGHRYRLPSASEWEYAARAGGAAAAPWQHDPARACASANVADHSAEQRYPGWNVFPCDDGYVYTAPVGSFEPNGFGLSDMLGNVLVWTQDCWQPDYTGAPADGSARVTADCREHEVRGGSWFSAPAVVTASYRDHFGSAYRTSSVGMRVVREMDP